jgi:Na+:H+ antiporter, NhaA family
MNRAGVRGPLLYTLLGACLWVAFLKSGVHATVAGVLLAMTIPSWERINSRQFVEQAREMLDRFSASSATGSRETLSEDQQAAVLALERSCEQVETPLHRFEHALHPWTTFFIMPVFALANAGVRMEGGFADALAHPVSLGVILGLAAGKQAGITLFAWATVKLGLARLPEGVTWLHVYGAAWVGGIGFTMSLFIASLAFGETPLLSFAKVGILAASLVSGIGGLLILRAASSRP